jgi:hypothetical protein
MKEGMKAYVDEGRPELGPIIFCLPDRGYQTALASYSPWTWLNGASMFFRAVLCLHCPKAQQVGRGERDAKQCYTEQADVVGVDIEVCRTENMSPNQWFFPPLSTTGPGRQRASAAIAAGMVSENLQA